MYGSGRRRKSRNSSHCLKDERRQTLQFQITLAIDIYSGDQYGAMLMA